ncbi:hypothetical protein I4U23_013053 [Adineta vaga]|nr:hypothetical protein I4U23_013053 [Adineta vaga]
MQYALLQTIIIVLLLINITNGVCVNNDSCRSVHVELYNRGNCKSCFSKKVGKNSKQCCDAGNKDCWRDSKEDSLFWVDCDTDKRKKKGIGQTIVACTNCEINFYDSGLIVVAEDSGSKRTLTTLVKTCHNI